MTESEKEELQKKALAVLWAMKSEKKYFADSPVERLVDDNEKSQTFIKRFRVGEYTFKEKMTAEEYARRYGHECYTRELKRREDARKYWGKIFERANRSEGKHVVGQGSTQHLPFEIHLYPVFSGHYKYRA